MKPVVIAVLYFLLIPVFALIYWNIPTGFYAPYAKNEWGGKLDASLVSQTFSSAFERKVEKLLAIGRSVADVKWRRGPIPVEYFTMSDEWTFRFQLTLRLSEPFVLPTNAGAMQFTMNVRNPVPLNIWKTDQGETGAYLLLDLDYDVPDAVINKLPPDAAQVIRAARDDFGIIEFTASESELLSRFIRGAAGDPTELSGGFLRMLYLSAIVVTTVGFGDIVPMTELARGCVALEALLGIVLAGLFVNSVPRVAPPRASSQKASE